MNFSKVLVVALAVILGSPAEAGTATDRTVRGLVAKVQKRIRVLQESDLIQFLPSPGDSVEQGGSLTLFVRPKVTYSGANILLDAYRGSEQLTLARPTTELWQWTSEALHELKSHEIRVVISIEDKELSAQLRNSLVLVDRDILLLEQKIAVETDPVKLADFIAQRDAKLVLRADLIASLNSLKTPVGEETFQFRVVPAAGGANYPRINRLTPNYGPQGGTATIEVEGENFSSTGASEVVIGGASTPATILSPSRIRFSKPEFASAGAKDVEVRLSNGSEIKNAILKNGFFAISSVEYPVINVAPVAVAQGSSIAHGAQATLDGTNSYDSNLDPLSYVWTLVSVPQGSSLVSGSQIGTAATASFTPDVPGSYVVALVVRETTTQELYQSAASLAVVTVSSPANTAPSVSTNPASLTVAKNGSVSATLTTSDAQHWQSRSVVIIGQPSLGTASISGNTLSYVAGNSEGSDMIRLLVSDSGNPPAFGYLDVPVTIVATNSPPSVTALSAFQMSEGVPLQMRWNTVASDSDGTITQYRYLFGDGFLGFGSTTANQFGSVFHDYVGAGPFLGQVWVRDNLGAETTMTANLDLTARLTNRRPVNRVTASVVSGSAPLTVNFNGSASFDPDGTINIVRWNWADGSAELQGGQELLSVSKTFNLPGIYNVRFRLRDNLNAESDHFIAIYVGSTPPSGGTAPTADGTITPRQVTFGSPIAFDAARSNDPNPGAGPFSSYAWSIQDAVTCAGQPGNTCSYSGQTTSHTFGAVGNYFPSLVVTGSGGTASTSRIVEVFVVNQGHAPRAHFRASPTSGVVPFTVSLDSSGGRSGDYDGTIVSHAWAFGDGTPDGSGETTAHQFVVPGVYFVNHKVTDNDGNTHTASQMVTASSSFRVARTVSDDEDRAAQRALLVNACGQGQGEACYWLAKMHEEDNDSFTAQKLFERACELGHAAACSVWMKW